MRTGGIFRFRDEEGVSNIIGVVLILAIALMVLVSAFAVLNALPPAAQAPASVKMQNMQLENFNNPLASNGYLVVSFVYESGPTLTSSSSDFVVFANNVSYEYPLSSLGLSSISAGTVVSFNSSDTLSPDIGGNHMMPLIEENSAVGMELTKFGKPVWTSSHEVQMEMVKPVIANSWVSGYVGQPFTLYASIESEYNVSVTGNFSLLYSGSSYDNVTLSPVGGQGTYDVSLPAVDHTGYYEIEVWVLLPSGKGGAVDQWYQLTQSGTAVVTAGVVDFNIFVRGLPGSIWTSHDLPLRIGGNTVAPPPSVPPLATMPTQTTLPPWYDSWVHIDQNNSSLSTLGYQVVGVTGVDQYLSVNDSNILAASWDGAFFVGISVIDNGQAQSFTSLYNNLFLIPDSGIVDIYVNFTSLSRVVVAGTLNIYNQSTISFTIGVGQQSTGYSVSAGSLTAYPPQDVYSYPTGSVQKVTMSNLASSVGQDVYATYLDGSPFNFAMMSPGTNVTIVINAIQLSYGNVTFDIYGLSSNVASNFALQYNGGSYVGPPGQHPMPVALTYISWGLHSFSVPTVLYSPNGVYKYVLQSESAPGITVSSDGSGSFNVIYLQQTYPIVYMNKTIYYTVTPLVSPSNSGGMYYTVGGQTYYTQQSFVAGTQVTFYAYNTSKYFGFSYFTGTISGSYSTASHFSLQLVANDTEIAVFSNLYEFELSVNGYGTVVVTVNYANGSVLTREIGYSQSITVFPIQPGSTVQMVASDLYGSSFTGYSGTYSSGSSTYTVTVNANVSETASFQGGHPPRAITVTVNGTGTAYFDGYSTTSTMTIIVPQGTSFSITESPGSNYEFVSYTGFYGSTTQDSLPVTVNSNGTEYVNFQPVSVSLTVYIFPGGGGTATVNGAVDTSVYTISVNYGSTVSITEQNSQGYTFGSYSGYYSSSQTSVSFAVTSDGNEYVNFNVVYVQVSVEVSPVGDGDVVMSYNNNGVTVTSSDTVSVPWGTSISLAASPYTGYYFSSFGGDYGGSSGNTMNFQAEGNGTEYAYFDPLVQYSVTIQIEGQGSAGWYGAASGSTPSYDTFNAYSGSTITLYEYQSNPNFDFSQFSGTFGSGYNSQITFTVSSSGTEYVYFNYIYSSITIEVSPGSGGTASWSGAASGSTSSYDTFNVLTGSTLSLSESPASNYGFTGYSGTYSNTQSSTTIFSVSVNGTEYVNFQYLYANVSIDVNPSGDGTVSISENGIFLTSTSTTWSESVLIGTSITVQSSNTVTGWVFNSYSGSFGGSSNSYWSFTVTGSGTEYVNFNSNAHTFTLIVNPSGADAVTVVYSSGSPTSGSDPTSNSVVITYYGASDSISLSYAYTSSYTFISWSGYYSGTGSTADFTVYGNATEDANFQIVIVVHYNTITVVVAGQNGEVYVSGSGTDQYVVGSQTFTVVAGTSVTLELTYTDTGYTFAGYTGNYGNEPASLTTYIFSVNTNGTETANFNGGSPPPPSTYTVYMDVEPGGAGTLTYYLNGTYAGSLQYTTSVQASPGTAFTFTQSPSSGYTFSGYGGAWGDVSGFVLGYSGGTFYANYTAASPGQTYTLTAYSYGPGSVYFWYNGQNYSSGINGNNAINLNIAKGTTIYLYPVPSSTKITGSGIVFQGWHGMKDANQYTQPLQLTVNKNGTEIGNFLDDI